MYTHTRTCPPREISHQLYQRDFLGEKLQYEKDKLRRIKRELKPEIVQKADLYPLIPDSQKDSDGSGSVLKPGVYMLFV